MPVLTENLSVLLLLLSVFAGCLMGVVSGLIPGLHSNNIALLLVSVSPVLIENGIPAVYIICMILANCITHTFHDIIPAIYLGVPNSDMALAVLPGHQLLLDGRGPEAIRLSALGSAGSVIVSIILLLPFGFLLSTIYPLIQDYIGWILLFIALIMIITEKGEHIPGQGSFTRYRPISYAFLVFMLSGLLGIFAFGKENMASSLFGSDSPSILLPLLSGLFGASQLVVSLTTGSVIPPQHTSLITLPANRTIKAITTGSLAGSFVAWLPGVSSSVATLLAELVGRIGNKKDHDKYNMTDDPLNEAREFIISVSGVNTANAVFGLFVFFFIGRARNGAIVAMSSFLEPSAISTPIILILLCVVILASIFSYYSTIRIGNTVHLFMEKIDYRKLSITVLTGLSVMVIVFTGVFGVIIFLMATSIGLLPSFMNVRKSNAMGVILLPVILYFL
ncbi:putative membrane protein [Methanomethylovorans hollandica DSM 15978]|uniref:Putative membrane protein n=1 Tax=Methanomethylovorans hollandica (strain DSM 15978 / NBRC 107637 / DMS1) TaxID=867904 RepID=L0KX22_METHD|nr:tripartite tricarboxylate transporter permease [Methanomethylovorans hollandica]AGB49240.1 putative membrane protein [Methanomethylovorans hollandica DSM 15978]